MKRFDELALNISEEEYRNNGRFHYSDIAGYMREGFSYLIKPQKEESESLTFGSMVDCIVTEGIDRFDEKYCVAKEFNLSDNQKNAIRELLHFGYDRLEDIPPQTVMELLGMYYKNPQSQFSKLLEAGSGYYAFLRNNNGKTPVDFQMFQDAVDTANALLTDRTTKSLFVGNGNDVDRFFQLKFNGDYNGIPLASMTDLIYVEHSTKSIWLVDLKSTCANYEWEFPKSFVKYRYDVQGKVYTYVVRQNMDNDDFYKGYTIKGFIFVYISRMNKRPLLWTFDKCFSSEDIEFTAKNGNRVVLEDFRRPLMEMHRIKTENLNVPVGIRTVNDVMEHLKDY